MHDSNSRPSRAPFFIALIVLLHVGVIALAYAWRRSRQDGEPLIIERAATVPSSPMGYVRGSPDAPVEIVEFADFECPGCGEFATQVEPEVQTRLIETGLARFRFLDLQVNESHRNSPLASVAAACANDQGKFWEMHDRIFAGQADWSSGATRNPKPIFHGYARAIGIDANSWEECFDARRHADQPVTHAREAGRISLRYTPSFVIGDQLLAGGQSFDAIKAAVDLATGPSRRPTRSRSDQ